VCATSTKDFKIDCQEGKNSPLNRPEFVDIDVSGQGGQSSSEDEEEE
jgi:hypothetical protein